MGFITSGLCQRIVGDLAMELGFPGAKHIRRALRAVRRWWISPTQLLGHLDLRRVGMRQRNRLDQSSLVDDVDHTPIGELWHCEVRHVVESRFVVDRGHQQAAALRQEALGQLIAFLLGDLIEDAGHEHRLARLVEDRRRLHA